MPSAKHHPKLGTFSDGRLRRYFDKVDGNNVVDDYSQMQRRDLLAGIREALGITLPTGKGGKGGKGGKNPNGVGNNGVDVKTVTPKWAKHLPKNGVNAARQMSMNAGNVAMPGGATGAVWIPRIGTDAKPTMNIDPATYGMRNNYGEALFFQQAMNGGVAPISAFKTLGVPKNWNPGIPRKDPVDPVDPGDGTGTGNGGDGSGTGNTGTGSGTGQGTGDGTHVSPIDHNKARMMAAGVDPNVMAALSRYFI